MRPFQPVTSPVATAMVLGALLCCGNCLADDCLAPDFLSTPIYEFGESTWTVEAGDFNRDGKLDLAEVGGSENRVGVLLGNGDGTFYFSTNYPVGASPRSIAIGDVNQDGKLDLIVANIGSDNVSVLLGDGNGAFGSATNFSAGSAPSSIGLGDFNRDGKVDLAVANANSTNASVLLGNGDGTFQGLVNFAAGQRPVSLAVGDLNRDGKTDLAIANESSTNVSVLLGNGDGTFQSAVNYATRQQPASVTIADFNGDGKPDLAVADNGPHPLANSQLGAVSILLGNGDGTFQEPVGYQTGQASKAIVAGDFDDDGKEDLAVVNYGSWNVSILLGNGDGTFQTGLGYAAGGYPRSVALGDFDGNGKLDLVVGDEAAYQYGAPGAISVVLGNGNGTFEGAATFNVGDAGSRPYSIAVADFNDDGNPDLAVGNFSAPYFSILLGDGNGMFRAGFSNTVGAYFAFEHVATDDFNGDGKADLAIGNNGVWGLLGNGDGTFQPAMLHDAVGNAVATGDLNGDSKIDLVVCNTIDASLSVLLGKGDGSFVSPTNYVTERYPSFAIVADLNGDAKPDVVAANAGSSSISVFLGNGDGSLGLAVNYPAGTSPELPACIATADFNGDGKPDLAVSGKNSASILFGNGDGTFQNPVLLEAEVDSSVVTADFNGDGVADLAVAHLGPSSVSVFIGKGDGTFRAPAEYGGATIPISAAVADFDGDGKPDLVTAGDESTVTVLLNKSPCAGIRLDATKNTTSLTLSWPYPSPGFILESTASLTSNTWRPTVEEPVTNNASLKVTVPIDTQGRYFRLRKP